MLNRIFRLEKIYKPSLSLTQNEVKKYVNGLHNFEFSETKSEMHGGFVLNYGWAEGANPMLISVHFLFSRHTLDYIHIRPTFRVYMFLIGIPLVILGVFIETIRQSEFDNPIALALVMLGMSIIFFFIRYFTKLKIKATREKLQLG